MRPAWLCLLILLTISTASLAAVPYLAIQAGAGTYDMTGVNEFVHELNDRLDGPSADKIDGGSQFGGSLGVTLDDGYQFELGYIRLNGKTEAADASGSLEFNLPAQAFVRRGLAPFSGQGRLQPQLGVAAGLITTSGTLRSSSEGNHHLTGGSFYFEGALGLAIWMTRSAQVELAAGYRQAKIRDVMPQTWRDAQPDLGAVDLDYSGLPARIGARLMLPPRAE